MDTQKAHQAKAAKMEAGTLLVSTNPAQKARNILAQGKRVSAHQAIKAKCWECMGGTADEWDADTRRNIRECTCGPDSSLPCALYQYRPYK